MNNVIYVHSIHRYESNPRRLGHVLKDMGYLVRDGRRKSVTRSRYFEQLIRRHDAYIIDSHEGSSDNNTVFELEIPDGIFFDKIKSDLLRMRVLDEILVMDKRLNGFSIGGRRYELRNGGYRKSKALWSESPADPVFFMFLNWMKMGSRYLPLEIHTTEEEITKNRNVRRITKLMNFLAELDI